jgi:hypothetical protein
VGTPPPDPLSGVESYPLSPATVSYPASPNLAKVPAAADEVDSFPWWRVRHAQELLHRLMADSLCAYFFQGWTKFQTVDVEDGEKIATADDGEQEDVGSHGERCQTREMYFISWQKEDAGLHMTIVDYMPRLDPLQNRRNPSLSLSILDYRLLHLRSKLGPPIAFLQVEGHLRFAVWKSQRNLHRGGARMLPRQQQPPRSRRMTCARGWKRISDPWRPRRR